MIVRVVTFGESMGLIRGSGIGSFAQLANADIDTGGAEGNVAIGLVRLGVPVSWVGRVGHDSIGRRVTRDLRGEGVEVHAIVDHDAPTGLMLKHAPRSGFSVVDYYRSGSAGSRLRPEDLDVLDIEHADLLHITGITAALSDSARTTVFEALRRARNASVRVSFDVNHRGKLWGAEKAGPVYRAIAAAADILFAGDDEAALLLEDSPPAPEAVAAGIGRLGPSEVVLKHGADGATAWATGISIHRAAAPVPVVDTVGAGDAFVAGYLSEVLANSHVDVRLDTATLAGAFACGHPGDWQGAARLEELRGFKDDPVTR